MKATAFGISVCIFFPTPVFSAALETSNQSIAIFLQPNNYAEFSTAFIDANISGNTYRPEATNPSIYTETSTQDFVNHFYLSNAALKLQLDSNWSVALIYDQPFGTDVSYALDPIPTSPDDLVNAVRFKVDSNNLTALVGYQPNQYWNVYTGLSYQTLKTHLKISGQSMGLLVDYIGDIKKDSASGWLTGVSYQRPEYALQSSLTYRSKIRHTQHFQEQISTVPAIPLLNLASDQNTTIETPQSVNLEFQTGITANHLIYGSVRWVNWQSFKITSPLISSDSDTPIALVDYQTDQWSTTLGLVHVFNDKFTSIVDIGVDSGNGNPASTLSPSDGFYSFGVGGFYNIHPNLFIAGGIKYLKLNKAKIQQDQNGSGSLFGPLSSVNNNNAVAYGGKVGYRF
ncbi:outer membrane protein transport protein [Acinetobacter terrae]|uniref:Transport of long-chain fatty acid n=1 Tax=Acinetobacter terrae TaxID=2731247 RepID=A0ABX1V4B1_9GAMM|nr:outer membrane protein transport protein [Acinetobacter terrae]NNH88450.1 transport of long-chain fatty acid [Acinetobacter terrae]